MQMGERKWVVLNSMETARELLDRRGKLYISRPEFAVTQDILSRGKRIVMMEYSERWRTLRKIMHQLLMASKVRIQYTAIYQTLTHTQGGNVQALPRCRVSGPRLAVPEKSREIL